MPLIHMVIADQDEAYLHQLARWFRENKPQQFQITAFTEKKSFMAFLEEAGEALDVVLVGMEFLTPDLFRQDRKVIVLGQPVQGYDNLQAVEKYQPAPALASEILVHMSASDEISPKWNRTGSSELWVFWSPEPQPKSTLALLQSVLSPDTLYVSLESFPFYSLHPETYQNYRNLSDILYHIKASKGNNRMLLESVVCIDSSGISFIPPMDNPGDIWELSMSDTSRLIESLTSWGRFKKIVVDLEGNVSSHTLKWLEAARRIVIPFSEAQAHQTNRFIHLIKSLHGNCIEKLILVPVGHVQIQSLPNGIQVHAMPGLKGFDTNWKQQLQEIKKLSELFQIQDE